MQSRSPRLTVSPLVVDEASAVLVASQHTYRAPEPVDRAPTERRGILAVHHHEQRDVDHDPRQTGGFQGADHALSFDIGISSSIMNYSMI
jgi:hypothetical protein